MTNVVRLFDRKYFELVVPEDERIATAMKNVSIANKELNRAVKELSNHFDAIENAIASIDDTEVRNRLTRSTKLSRETLLRATLQLTQKIETVVCCHGD